MAPKINRPLPRYISDAPETLSVGSLQRWGKVNDCETAGQYVFNGRTGNNVACIAHVLFFANHTGIKRVKFPGPYLLTWRHVLGVIPVFESIDLDVASSASSECRTIDAKGKCFNLAGKVTMKPGEGYFGKWWNLMCLRATAGEYHAVLERYLQPMLTPECKQVMAAQAGMKDSVTIHLRADDLFNTAKKPGAINDRFWDQAPCGMYEKIIREGGYKRALVVTDPAWKHPCVRWAQENPLKSLGVQIVVQSKSSWEDYCTLAGSMNVVVSDSSFAHTAVVLGAPRNIYMFGLITDARHWLLDCQTAPGTSVSMYSLPQDATAKYERTVEGVAKFFREHPWQDVTGPLPCNAKVFRRTVPR